MDFWSRLIGGVGIAPARKPSSNNPQQRLSRFKKTYSLFLQSWNKVAASSTSSHPLAEETVRVQLGRLTSLLHDDTRASVPHLCLAFASSSQIYLTVGNIALQTRNEQIALEAVSFFCTLVDSDEEGLLKDPAFGRTIMEFVDHLTSSSSFVKHAEFIGEVLELLFGIAAKIRLEPDILPAWFHPRRSTVPQSAGSTHNSNLEPLQWNSKEDFPLCYRFIGYVYHEGRIGDFARTGLLYIFESASSSDELECWIINSDLPTLMASGLGALYSQLSRKLTFAYALTEMPLILALSDLPERQLTAATESFYSADLQAQLSTFLSYLHFWQDLLYHSKSAAIKQTLIKHFRVFFLQQILYPSLLESSDIDGGSSVAVQTYLWRILDAVKHPDLIGLILSYLLAWSGVDGEQDVAGGSHPMTSQLGNGNPHTILETSLNPSFFNLSDLILANVSSRNPETKCAALRTISVLISKHHNHASASLLKTFSFKSSRMIKPTGQLNEEICFILNLAQRISPGETLDESYDACLKDALGSIETHVCYDTDQGSVGTGDIVIKPSNEPSHESSRVRAHGLDPNDSLLRALCQLLESFLHNEVEVNLGLTNVFIQLLSCPSIRLEGFLTSLIDIQDADIEATSTDPSTDIKSPVLGQDRQENADSARPQSYKSGRAYYGEAIDQPTLLKILLQLTQQIETIRHSIPGLSGFFANRKRALFGSIEMDSFNISVPARISASRPANQFQQRPVTPSHAVRDHSDVDQSPLGHKSRPNSPITTQSSTSSKPNNDHRRPRPELQESLLWTSKRDRQLSPLKSSFEPGDGEQTGHGSATPTAEEFLKVRLQFNHKAEPQVMLEDYTLQPNDSSASPGPRVAINESKDGKIQCSSLHHVLTNAVILQEFILELAALAQTRASLLTDEVSL